MIEIINPWGDFLSQEERGKANEFFKKLFEQLADRNFNAAIVAKIVLCDKSDRTIKDEKVMDMIKNNNKHCFHTLETFLDKYIKKIQNHFRTILHKNTEVIPIIGYSPVYTGVLDKFHDKLIDEHLIKNNGVRDAILLNIFLKNLFKVPIHKCVVSGLIGEYYSNITKITGFYTDSVNFTIEIKKKLIHNFTNINPDEKFCNNDAEKDVSAPKSEPQIIAVFDQHTLFKHNADALSFAKCLNADNVIAMVPHNSLVINGILCLNEADF